MARSPLRARSAKTSRPRTAAFPHVREPLLDERRRVDDERDALIAELRGAREAAHALERRAERLDDDVLLAHEVVDDEPEPARTDARDDRIGARALGAIAHVEALSQVAERQRRAPE